MNNHKYQKRQKSSWSCINIIQQNHYHQHIVTQNSKTDRSLTAMKSSKQSGKISLKNTSKSKSKTSLQTKNSSYQNQQRKLQRKFSESTQNCPDEKFSWKKSNSPFTNSIVSNYKKSRQSQLVIADNNTQKNLINIINQIKTPTSYDYNHRLNKLKCQKLRLQPSIQKSERNENIYSNHPKKYNFDKRLQIIQSIFINQEIKKDTKQIAIQTHSIVEAPIKYRNERVDCFQPIINDQTPKIGHKIYYAQQDRCSSKFFQNKLNQYISKEKINQRFIKEKKNPTIQTIFPYENNLLKQNLKTCKANNTILAKQQHQPQSITNFNKIRLVESVQQTPQYSDYQYSGDNHSSLKNDSQIQRIKILLHRNLHFYHQ